MRYALLLYLDPEVARTTTDSQAQDELAAYGAITAELAATGVLQGGEAFMPAATAQVVTMRDRQVRIAAAGDAARELSGFYLVDCTEAEALDIAARLPVVAHGAVEVRPLMELPEPGAV